MNNEKYVELYDECCRGNRRKVAEEIIKLSLADAMEFASYLAMDRGIIAVTALIREIKLIEKENPLAEFGLKPGGPK